MIWVGNRRGGLLWAVSIGGRPGGRRRAVRGLEGGVGQKCAPKSAFKTLFWANFGASAAIFRDGTDLGIPGPRSVSSRKIAPATPVFVQIRIRSADFGALDPPIDLETAQSPPPAWGQSGVDARSIWGRFGVRCLQMRRDTGLDNSLVLCMVPQYVQGVYAPPGQPARVAQLPPSWRRPWNMHRCPSKFATDERSNACSRSAAENDNPTHFGRGRSGVDLGSNRRSIRGPSWVDPGRVDVLGSRWVCP